MTGRIFLMRFWGAANGLGICTLPCEGSFGELAFTIRLTKGKTRGK